MVYDVFVLLKENPRLKPIKVAWCSTSSFEDRIKSPWKSAGHDPSQGLTDGIGKKFRLGEVFSEHMYAWDIMKPFSFAHQHLKKLSRCFVGEEIRKVLNSPSFWLVLAFPGVEFMNWQVASSSSSSLQRSDPEPQTPLLADSCTTLDNWNLPPRFLGGTLETYLKPPEHEDLQTCVNKKYVAWNSMKMIQQYFMSHSHRRKWCYFLLAAVSLGTNLGLAQKLSSWGPQLFIFSF